MRTHLHNKEYRPFDYDCYPHLTITSAILIGAGIAAAGAVGGSMYSVQAEKTQQKKILADQEAKAAAVEQKAATAEATATEAAKAKVVNKKRALTQTILTSPLGIQDESGFGTQRPTLLGGI